MLILIRGAGDIASGIALRLHRSGSGVVMTDLKSPTAVRRTVCFCEAIRQGKVTVEDVEAVHIPDHEDKILLREQILECIRSGRIPVLEDPECRCLEWLAPDVLVDAVLAKKNLGTGITDAPMVIGVGPGFTAGEDCHAVIETKRGHTLGRVIMRGSAAPNTGIPGNIGGYTTERVLRSPAEGVFKPVRSIADTVSAGDTAAYVGDEKVVCAIGGVLRGLLAEGTYVTKGMKCGDVDPRCERSHCFSVSDKALAVGGGVLEAVCRFERDAREASGAEGSKLTEQLAALAVSGRKAVICSIISSEGSVPRKEGAVMAVTEDGKCFGTIGGGAVERMALEKAKQILRDPGIFGPAAEITYELDSTGKNFLRDKKAEDTGMICGGRIRVRFSSPGPEMAQQPQAGAENEEGTVWIIGAGHVGRALAGILSQLGERYSVADDRPGAASRLYFPGADRLVWVSYDALEKDLHISSADRVVVTTYGHRGDLSVLTQVLKADPAYVGCIGSHRKAGAIREALAGLGFSKEQTGKIHSPVGLEIGAATPGEIAVSIAAEMILERHKEKNTCR